MFWFMLLFSEPLSMFSISVTGGSPKWTVLRYVMVVV